MRTTAFDRCVSQFFSDNVALGRYDFVTKSGFRYSADVSSNSFVAVHQDVQIASLQNEQVRAGHRD